MLEVVDLNQFIEENCIISSADGQILISCKSRKAYNLLLQYEAKIEEIVYPGFEKQSLTLGVAQTEIRHCISLKKIITNPMEIITPNDFDLIRECWQTETACAIVRSSDDKGLFANPQITISRAKHSNWIGAKMSDYWLEDELIKYKDRLAKEKELRNYEYVAILFDGNKVKQRVDARIVTWLGEEARIVKVLSQELI